MDEPITKRLIISGLTPAISAEDISRRLTSFGTVKAADGFGLQNGVDQPRKFAYVTLETTTGKLSKCMNLLSGSTWKGAKLRFGEAKPDFAERIAAENKKAAEDPEPPKKKRRRYGVLAEDMSLVTPENVSQKPGWKVSSVGRITYPVKMRPAHPLGEPLEETKPTKRKKAGEKVEEKKKKKRVKDPDTRARRKVIDMPKYGSTLLKGMFLDLEVSTTRRESPPRQVQPESSSESESEESEGEVTVPPPPPPPAVVAAGPSKIQPDPLPSPPKTTTTIQPAPAPTISEELTNVQKETTQSLSLLNSLFGQDDDDWMGRESVGSDIDADELVKGDKMLEEEGGIDFEIVPKNASGSVKGPVRAAAQNQESDSDEDEDDKMVTDAPEPEPASLTSPPKPTTTQKTLLKDLFAPREEEAGFSLLGHLDLDLELDEDAPFIGEQPMDAQPQHETSLPSIPAPLPTSSTYPNQTTLVLNPRQVLFFPLPPDESSTGMRARQKDVFDLAKDNRWNWRDPAVGFYRTGTEEDIKKRWEESKGDLTRDWKRRCREASKVNRRKKGGVEDADI